MSNKENLDYLCELDTIKSLLQKFVDKQENMDGVLKNMDKTLTQLNQTVVGNATYGQKGLVSELAEIKKYVEKDKMFKNKMTGGLIVIGVVWTILLEFFSKIFILK